MAEHSLQDQQAALNLAALLGSGSSSQDSVKDLLDAMIAGLSGTGAVEIIAKGSVAKLIRNPAEANDADVSMLDALIQMGKEAEAMKAERLAKWVDATQRGGGSESPPPGERRQSRQLDGSGANAQQNGEAVADNAAAKVEMDADVDMDNNVVPAVPVATSSTSSPAPQGEKRKLGDKNGHLDAEDRARAKRSKSR